MKIKVLYLITIIQTVLCVYLFTLVLSLQKPEPCEPFDSVIKSSTQILNTYFKCDINKTKKFFEGVANRENCSKEKIYHREFDPAFAIANCIAIDTFFETHVVAELTYKFDCNYDITKKWLLSKNTCKDLLYGFQLH